MDSIRVFYFKRGLPIEFEVLDLMAVKRSPKLFAGPFKATFYQIVWVEEGEIVLLVDFCNIRIGAGQMAIISLNQVYGFDARSDFRGRLILFTDSFFNEGISDALFLRSSEIFNPIRLNVPVAFPRERMRLFLELFDSEADMRDGLFKAGILRRLLGALLLDAERLAIGGWKGKTDYREMNIGRAFFDAVEIHFKVQKKVVFYTVLLVINEKLLTREVKLLTGKTPKEYIDARLVLEAKRLLAYSMYSVKEIGFALGWDEATNFNKFFKKHVGLTPLAFREKSV